MEAVLFFACMALMTGACAAWWHHLNRSDRRRR